MILSSSLFTFIFIKAEGGWKDEREGKEEREKRKNREKKNNKTLSVCSKSSDDFDIELTRKITQSCWKKEKAVGKMRSIRPGGMLGVRYVCLSPARVCLTYLSCFYSNLLCLPPKLQHIYRSVFTSVASLWTPTPAFNIMVPLLFGISTSSILFTKRKVAGSVRSNRKSFWSSTNISRYSFNLSL